MTDKHVSLSMRRNAKGGEEPSDRSFSPFLSFVGSGSDSKDALA